MNFINIKNAIQLKIAFFISLFSILASILFTAFFNKIIYFYYASYLFSIYFIFIYFLNYRKAISRIYMPIFILIAYFIFVTLPITITLSNIKNLAVYFKNNLLFIPILLYAKIKFKTILETINFIKTIVIGGIFFSIYIIFEFVNKLFQFFPFFNKLILDYISISKNDYLTVFADTENIGLESAIRPLGLELNFTSGAFFLSSIFLILLFSGWRFFKKKRIRIFLLFLLYLSIIISTSRQNILFLNIFIFWIFLQNILGNFDKRLLIHNIDVKNSLRFIIFFVLIGFSFLITKEQVYSDFISGKSGGTSEILLDDISSLLHNISLFIINYPFNFLFGIGAYTPEDPGIYYNLPPVNELHFLLDTFYTLGLVGFLIFWYIFLKSLNILRTFRDSNKRRSESNFNDLRASFYYITILFITSNVHYSPIGIITIFIIFLIILLPIQLNNEANI